MKILVIEDEVKVASFLKKGLEQSGYDAETDTYRLIEVDLADLEDARWFPGPRPWGTEMVEALRRGERLPPVVVVKSSTVVPSVFPGSTGPGVSSSSQWTVMRRPLMATPPRGRNVMSISSVPVWNPRLRPPVASNDTKSVAAHVPLATTAPLKL